MVEKALRDNNGSILASVARHRKLWLSSPLWLAATFIVISRFSPAFRDVIEFMTASPLR